MSLNFKETLGISIPTSEYIEDCISEISSCYDLEKDVLEVLYVWIIDLGAQKKS